MVDTTHPYGAAIWGAAVHEVLTKNGFRVVLPDGTTRDWTEADDRTEPEETTDEPGDGGIILDLFSASGIAAVWGALKPETRAKFEGMNLVQAHHVAFAVLNKARK